MTIIFRELLLANRHSCVVTTLCKQLEIGSEVLGADNPNPQDIILEHRIRWLGYILRVLANQLLRRALFVVPGLDWKKCRGGQPMTGKRNIKNATSCFVSAVSVCLPGWGPRDEDSKWLKVMEAMARNQWRQCRSDIFHPTFNCKWEKFEIACIKQQIHRFVCLCNKPF